MLIIGIISAVMSALAIILGFVFLINNDNKDPRLVGFSWILLGVLLGITSIHSMIRNYRADENDIINHTAHYDDELIIKGNDTIILHRIEFNKVRP